MSDTIRALIALDSDVDLDTVHAALRDFMNAHVAVLGINFDKKSPPAVALNPEQVEQLRLWLRGQAAPVDAGAEKFLNDLDAVPLPELVALERPPDER